MDCREFENKIWSQPNNYSSKDNLPDDMMAHLNKCPECAGVYEDFLKMFLLSGKAEIAGDESYWQNFENNVWDKIESSEKDSQAVSNSSFRPRYNLGFKQLFASLTVAAGTVAMLMLAVSNITNEPDIAPMMKKAENRLMNNSSLPISDLKQKRYELSFVPGEKGGLQFVQYSLLSEPEVNVIDDSSEVRIDAAYLTEDGLEDKDLSITRASIQDVERGMGTGDSVIPHVESELAEATPPEYIITVEKMPRMIKAVAPDYPPIAYRFKRGGDVWIKAFVDASGKVQRATVHKKSGSDSDFDEAALEAAYKNQFEPFEVNGRKTPVWVIYKVSFISKD